MQIGEAQKYMDPADTDPDPQYCWWESKFDASGLKQKFYENYIEEIRGVAVMQHLRPRRTAQSFWKSVERPLVSFMYVELRTQILWQDPESGLE
jgi:hypothetical protein